jgi:hypothetical protein
MLSLSYFTLNDLSWNAIVVNLGLVTIYVYKNVVLLSLLKLALSSSLTSARSIAEIPPPFLFPAIKLLMKDDPRWRVYYLTRNRLPL